MEYYAIKRKKDGAFVSGTDFSYFPPHCRIADEWAPPLLIPKVTDSFIKTEIRRRKINLKRYEIVTVKIEEIPSHKVLRCTDEIAIDGQIMHTINYVKCPRCGKKLNKQLPESCCPYCEWALDWSDEE